MRLWKKVLAGLAVVVTVFLVVGLLLPQQYEVERSITIDAPPEEIYGPVSTLNQWPTWTVWNTEKYPDMSYSYEGPDSGIGAKSNWNDPGAGNGRMEIVTADPQSGITYTLDFEGFARAYGSILFSPETGSQHKPTVVVMKMKGELGGNPLNRYFGLLMDGMMGAEFEESLQRLKAQVEASDTTNPGGAPDEPAPTAADSSPTAAPSDTPSPQPAADGLPTSASN